MNTILQNNIPCKWIKKGAPKRNQTKVLEQMWFCVTCKNKQVTIAMKNEENFLAQSIPPKDCFSVRIEALSIEGF